MKKKNCSIIGVGRMFFFHHYKNLKKNHFLINKVFAPRKKLLKHMSKKLSLKDSHSNISEFLKDNNTKYFFFFLPRDISFFYLKKILKKKNIFIFIEKPPVLYKKNFDDILRLLIKNNNKLFIAFQFRYSILLKKFKNNFKSVNRIDEINAEISLNYRMEKNFPYLKKDKLPSYIKEKVPKKFVPDNIKYKIFINRYSHLFNIIFYLFNDLKIKKIEFYDNYNYLILGEVLKKKIYIKINNNSNYRVSLKIKYKNVSKQIKFKFNNKNFITKINLSRKKTQTKYEDLYLNEIKNFLHLNHSEYKKQISDFKKTLKISEKCSLRFNNKKIN